MSVEIGRVPTVIQFIAAAATIIYVVASLASAMTDRISFIASRLATKAPIVSSVVIVQVPILNRTITIFVVTMFNIIPEALKPTSSVKPTTC